MVTNKIYFCFLVFVSLLLSIFYFFFINLSSDSVMLFLANKLYLGQWLNKGIFPLYNPQIFAGVPFVYDLGLGNLHPFNLFFILPFPLSFSLWVFAVSFLFLSGFYLFFAHFTKNKIYALVLTLILFFSGSGFFIRMNNPTIISVIAHYGWFFYALLALKNKGKRSILFSLFFGVLLTISGHIQFVFYAYIFGLIVAILFYKIPWRRVMAFFAILFLAVSLYYLLALPVVLDSTRVLVSSEFTKAGALLPAQIVELLFPFIYGEMATGARWGPGISTNIIISLLFSLVLLFLAIRKKMTIVDGVLLLSMILLSLGLFPIPYFRLPSQILILFHLFGLIIIAKNIKEVEKNFIPFVLKIKLLPILLFFAGVFFITPLFPRLFTAFYTNLFYDLPTVTSIGYLIGSNFFLLGLLYMFLLLGKKLNQRLSLVLVIYIIFEGILINSFHNYFLPNRLLQTKINLPKKIDVVNYRVQTASDVIPYFGYHNYVENVYFRPPFSKEKPLFDQQEQKNFSYLKNLFSYLPSSWSMVYGIKSVQGYNTFVPKEMAMIFDKFSPDYETQYAEIIKRNPLFNQSSEVTHINSINSSKITLTDKRWQDLSVKYFISDRELPGYNLIYKDHRYFYENSEARPIYTIFDGSTYGKITPQVVDPNKIEFKVTEDHQGKTLIINQNPGGFVAKLNNVNLPTEKEGLTMKIKLSNKGDLTVYYSPLLHLQEALKKRFF